MFSSRVLIVLMMGSRMRIHGGLPGFYNWGALGVKSVSKKDLDAARSASLTRNSNCTSFIFNGILRREFHASLVGQRLRARLLYAVPFGPGVVVATAGAGARGTWAAWAGGGV